MSKESKPRDRWRQRQAAANRYRWDFCQGCGYYYIANGNRHREDCTDAANVSHEQAIANIANICGITSVVDDTHGRR